MFAQAATAAAKSDDWVLTLAITVSLVALAFTALTFWILHLRVGRLEASPPHSYSLVSNPTIFHILLPLVIYNTGARTIVVDNLQLWFPDTKQRLHLPWAIKRTKLHGPGDSGHEFPAAFPINGRSAATTFIEFRAPMPGFTLTRGTHRARVEVIAWPKPLLPRAWRWCRRRWAKWRNRRSPTSWVTLLDFTLHVSATDSMLGSFLSYDNLPHEEMKLQGGSPLRNLLKELGQLEHFDAVMAQPRPALPPPLPPPGRPPEGKRAPLPPPAR
jgi:hypothetical protein